MMLAFKESHSLAVHYCRLVWDVRSLSYFNTILLKTARHNVGNKKNTIPKRWRSVKTGVFKNKNKQ